MAIRPTEVEIEFTSAVAERKRLESCINNLISIQALAAVWSGQESSRITGTLLEVLLRILRLDFAYARVGVSSDGSTQEFVRWAQGRTPVVQAQEVGRALAEWLGDEPPSHSLRVPNPLGEGKVSIAPLRLGLQEEIGVVVAGSQRPGFPTQNELLTLRVSVNQATIALREARRLSEQRRAAEVLEQWVAERTSQLTAVNGELRAEISKRERTEQRLALSAIGIQIGQFVERKRLEEEQRKLASLVENSTGFIGIASPEGQVLFVNAIGRMMVGLDGGEPVQATRILDYVVEEERPRFQQQILPAVMRHGHWEGETLFRHFRTGAAIPLLLHILCIKKEGCDRPIALATISRDITQRKLAEEALRKSQEQVRQQFAELQAIYSTAPVGLCVVGTGLRLIRINAQLAKMTGIPPQGYVGRTLREVMLGFADHLEPICQHVMQTSKPIFGLEFRGRSHTHPREECIWRTSYSPVKGRNGKVLAVSVVVFDITERQGAEEALHQAQAELAHVMRVMTMGELAASIAHEVNQPLTAVINNSNACLRWLAGQRPDLEGVRGALTDVIANGQRASNIIARIRAALKKAPAQAGRLEINHIIEEVRELTWHEVLRYGVQLHTELASGLPTVLGDHVQLQQVLMNLVMNGIEAMSSVMERPRRLLIRSSRAGPEGVLVTVQDTGIGLDPHARELIFDSFYTTKAEGMGMGLSICRTIIRAHGGRLWAECNAGAGATLQFTLPGTAEIRDD